MKQLFLFIFFCSQLIFAQKDTIEINQFKSTQIIFAEDILLVESGTGDLQVQTKILGGNILIVQSVVPKEDFIVTNLFIKTKSNIYNPIINFKENSLISTYQQKDLRSAIGNNKIIPTAIVGKNISNEISKQNKEIADKVCELNDIFKPSREYITGVWFRFYAHYIDNGKYYFKFEIENSSDLDYDIEQFFFSIKNKKKRNASVTLKQINYTDLLTDVSIVSANSKKCIIFEFDSFSINRDEEMLVEVQEQNGARNFKIGIPYFIVNKPIQLKNN